MSGAKFSEGDTVRVRESSTCCDLHRGTGEVASHLPSSRYTRVKFPNGDIAPFFDSELELVTDAPAPVPAMPGLVRTEWGVRTPEWGTSSARDLAAAETIAQNMRGAGHDASVVPGVTEWQSDSSPAAAQ